MNSPVPRFVPTLTDVLGKPRPPAPQDRSPDASGFLAAEPPLAHPDGARADRLEAELVHRVLQRVDMLLADRLSAAVATVVVQQTRAMLPALREEIAEAVRVSVSDALSKELLDSLPPAA